VAKAKTNHFAMEVTKPHHLHRSLSLLKSLRLFIYADVNTVAMAHFAMEVITNFKSNDSIFIKRKK
jgi:hypothetical protein